MGITAKPNSVCSKVPESERERIVYSGNHKRFKRTGVKGVCEEG